MTEKKISPPPLAQPLSPPLQRLMLQVADAVQAVRSGRSLTEVLAACPAELRPGTQALSFYVLRLLGSAEAARALLAPKTPPPKVDSLLVSALALLWPCAPGTLPLYTDHTVVDQVVSAARKRAPASAGFVNAVLRRFLRERAAIVQAAQAAEPAAFNHPQWWIDLVRADWPDHWQAILRANNQHPPMTLRVNARRGNVSANTEAYLARLAAAGIGAAVLGPLAPQALRLERASPVGLLPGFADGDVSVQDAAAQLAAPLVVSAVAGLPALPPGARVLDACSAPGGKTAHLLELAELEVLALDSDAGRLTRVQDNLHRLGVQAQTLAADARQTHGDGAWWDGRPFDAILLDAPCSASGIVRRHPDVRWLRRASDIGQLAGIQTELLDALWPTLRPGGRLVYVTCSIFKAEGAQQVFAFLQRHGDAKQLEITGLTGHLLPLTHNGGAAGETPSVLDGFFYALLIKDL